MSWRKDRIPTFSLIAVFIIWEGRDAHLKFKYSRHYFEFKVIVQEFDRD